MGIDAGERAALVNVIAARAHIHILSVVAGGHHVRVDPDLDGLQQSQCVDIKYGDGFVIIRIVQSAGIGHIEFAVADAETFGVVARAYGLLHFQGGGVNTHHIAVKAGNIRFVQVEGDMTRAFPGKTDGFDGFCCGEIHYFHPMGVVDHTVEFVAISFKVVSCVAKATLVYLKKQVCAKITRVKVVK